MSCVFVRFRLCGGEGGVRCWGKLHLPGVCSSLVPGGAQVDAAGLRRPAADCRSDTWKQRGEFTALSFHIKSIQVFTDVDSRVFFFSLLWLIHQKHYHDFSLWIFPQNVLLPLVLFICIFSPKPPKDKTLTDIIFWLNLSKQKQCTSERLCFCLTKIGRLKDVSKARPCCI